MTHRRDVTIDLTFHDVDNGIHNGVLQTSDGAYDISGDTIKELVAAGKELAEILGITIDVFNLEYPEQ